MKTKSKRLVAVLLALITAFGILPVGLTAWAATGTVYMVQLPRSGDPNQSGWGHGDLSLINGWSLSSTSHTTAKAIGGYEADTAYCIEPGINLNVGNSLTQKGEEFWNSYPENLNNSLSSAEIKLFIGRIFEYGWTGENNLSWNSNNSTHAQEMAEMLATQLLVWETVIGERDGEFKKVNAASYGKASILDSISGGHPLRSQILSHYNRIVESVQNHVALPSFLAKSTAGAQTVELTWNGLKYAAILTDTNNVLSNFSFSTSTPGIDFSVSGNKLTISAATASTDTISITASKKSSNRRTAIVWSDGVMSNSNNGQIQDLVYYGEATADPISGYVKAKIPAGNLKLIKVSEDGVIANIPFTITGNGINKSVVTGSNGEIVIDNLIAGTFTVTEGAIDRYEPQESRTVTIIGGQTSTVTFSNKLKRGTLEVIKSSEDNYNEGHKFKLSGTSLNGQTVNMYAVTNSQGVATFKDVLINGSKPYVLEEVDTAIRYVVPAKQNVAVKWNEVTRTTVTNTLKKFRVSLTKKDSEFSTLQGDAKIEGAVYGLYNGSELIARYTTDKNGQFTTDYYICGDNWTIRELSPSEGYLIDPTVYHVGAEAQLYTVEHNNAPSLTSLEAVKKGRVQIVKHTDDGSTQIETPEVGATFEIFLEKSGSYNAARPTERDILIIDNDGLATSKYLPYGIYRVRQLSGWDGTEKIRDFLCYVSEDGKTYTYIINNSTITSKLKIEKRNAEDGELIVAAGIGFMIKDPDGNFITQQVAYPTPTDISVFYTNTEGWLMLPQELDWGVGYQLIEVQMAPGFFLNDEPVPFDVTGETTIITVTKYNEPQKARIHITKNGEVFSSVTLADGMYRPEYKVQGLAGGVYDIIADEDIYLNNKLMVAKDTVVATLTTTKSGATSPLLYLGRYRVLERQAPHGMTLGQIVPKFVELSYRGQTVKEYTEGVSFLNERQRVKINFEKEMEQDEFWGIGQNGEIAAVRMGLYAETDIVAADGKKIPKDGLLEIVTVDTATGCGEFSVDLPVGSRVYLKETATDNHYILSNQKFPVVFEYAGQDTSIVELTANNGKPIENKIKRGNVEGLKVDENGEGLAGALIGLFTPDTIEFTEDNALLTDISGENGAFRFKGVPYGEWVCREIVTPGAAYVLDETVYPVNVTADKQVIKIKITDIFVRGDVEGLKLDEDGQGLDGALIGLFKPDETEFTKDSAVMTAVSSEGGKFTFEGILYGDWLVREIATPEARYVLDDTLYPVTVSTHKQTIKVEITDIYVRGSVKGLKLDEDCEGLAGAVIGLFNPDETEFTEDNAVMTAISAKNGGFSFDGILYGEWIVREIAPPQSFILSDVSYPVTVSSHKQIIHVVVSNTLIRGSVEGMKTNEDGEALAGAMIGLFYPNETEFTADNAVMTDISKEDGRFSFAEVIFGDWVCREIAPPSAAYVLSDKSHPVTIAEDKEVIKIEIENRYVRGSVRTTKVDAEYPDNKLSGAVFDVYTDTNGNEKFDEEIDLLAGTLDEIETGIYQLDGLVYSGYFLKERTSPDKFLLDENSYYFEILTDGETVEVENQASIGFINRPVYGELWLTKKDVSDGKLIPGCGIRIKDADGNTVVEGRTDENGVVKFRLRAGEYAYFEFDCPGYQLDESECPFAITEDGQIIKAEMTNEKIPEPKQPDIPKTGDESNPGLWLAIMGAAAGMLILTLRRCRKTSNAH